VTTNAMILPGVMFCLIVATGLSIFFFGVWCLFNFDTKKPRNAAFENLSFS
jgi:hypothetical protein